MRSRLLRYIAAGLSLAALCEASPGAVLSIGHRGNSLFAPENTLASFRAALGKADFVEMDGQVTSDGCLVVMHDATVNRTTDGSGGIATNTLAWIKSLDAGSWFSTAFTGERVPTLAEAITNSLPTATPLIEQKTGAASLYVDEFRRLGVLTNVVLQSFDWNFLSAVHSLEPTIPLCALGSGAFTAATLTAISNAGARRVAWDLGGVNTNMLKTIHDAGLTLFVWTVDGPAIKAFIDMGVDGIISNDPAMVRQLQQPGTNGTAALGGSLLTYWKMDDGLTNAMATTLSDSKGTNTAILTRTDGLSHWYEYPSSMFGGCLQVDGASASVVAARSGSLDIGTNSVTISLWVKLRTLPSMLTASYASIYDSTNDSYVIYLDKANKELRFKVTDASGAAARPGIPEAALKTNQWLHIVGTYSGQVGPVSGQACIYLNGVAKDVHTGSDASSPVGLTATVKPGQTAGMGREGSAGSYYFSGMLDDVALWTRALTPAEVAALYQAGEAGASLGDLLRQPTTAIEPKAIRLISATQLQVDFAYRGPWTTFRLLRSYELAGPFLAVTGIAPAPLETGAYRFTCPTTTNTQAFFRIEGN